MAPLGSRSLLRSFFVGALILLQGCSSPVLIVLSNQSQYDLVANDFSKGDVPIRRGETVLLDPGAELLIRRKDGGCSFQLRHLPRSAIHSTKRGFVAFAVFRDNKLYLAAQDNSKAVRELDPQPTGFPLKPQRSWVNP